jgi:hypothetical protein
MFSGGGRRFAIMSTVYGSFILEGIPADEISLPVSHSECGNSSITSDAGLSRLPPYVTEPFLALVSKS